jgi:tetratricopeptide (TPR) repeat protein
VGDALIESSPNPLGTPALAGSIARHYELGGRLERAAELHADAGRMASSLFAHTEALHHLVAALALGHPAPAALHESIGDTRVLVGDYAEAIHSYETAAALSDPDRLPGLEQKLADVYLRRGDWDLAEAHLQTALAGTTEPALLARIHADLSLTAFHKRALERAVELGHESLRAATVSADPRALAQAHNILGILANARGETDEAVRHLGTSLTLAEEIEEPLAETAALNNLALTERARGHSREAIELTGRALSLCAHHGDRHREAALHNNLADLLHATGDKQGAMDHLKQAATIFAAIGGEPTEMLPEVWKLVRW